ncbi:hypothetical protein JHN63_17715 [Streptomyces sp. MBT65]|uniref:hypothetical protein n=1 Tax=Streptomyces sp. MBT65 TaxID=1488395 RepID=UPI00190BDC18|nr:hypothetical protein [Streptomyces sp. MBT65]MBK3575619.1 hypothetical protein [Streptomyces sp. MBT65]
MQFSEPERLFKVWEYSRTHRTLLLRSDSDLALKPRPRIELSAGNVQVMFLRSLMRGLTVRRPSAPAETELLARKYGITEDLDYMFLLDSPSGEGLLVSGNPSWAMAEVPVDAPSFFSRVGETDRYPDAVSGQVA